MHCGSRISGAIFWRRLLFNRAPDAPKPWGQSRVLPGLGAAELGQAAIWACPFVQIEKIYWCFGSFRDGSDMFDINNSRGFYDKLLEESDDYMGQQASARHGMNCSITIRRKMTCSD
jgi:hypothetical protein